MENTLSNPPRSNWAIYQRSSSEGLYILSLIDLNVIGGINTGDQLSTNAIDVALIREFIFRVNPKSMSIEEPAAVTIVPTQDGGQFIEHQGQIYKNISLNGTTGMRPNRTKPGGIIPVLNVVNPFFKPNLDKETGLPTGERTGFDDLIQLRNLFRTYWDKKVNPVTAPSTVMVWQNGKEGEYYIVEPINFKTSRDASSPLTFSYDIQLRTIERLNINNLAKRKDSYAKKNGLEKFLSRVNDARQKLTQAFQLANAVINRTVNIAQSTITAVLGPVNDVLIGLTGIVVSGSRVFSIPRAALSDIATNAIELAVKIDGLTNNVYSSTGIITDLANVANAYKNMSRQLRAIAVEDAIFQNTVATVTVNKANAYRDSRTAKLPLTGGSPTDLNNVAIPSSASVSGVNTGEDIKRIAVRLLGDAARWKELVILNKLVQPYISSSGNGTTILRPGDRILVPSNAPVTAPTISQSNLKFRGISNLDQRLGEDLLLQVSQSAGGADVFDVVVGSNGDLTSVRGAANIIQALNLKFNMEQGELPTHPAFGLRAPIGTKAKIQTLVEFQLNARSTLLSDSRISAVNKLDVQFQGNTVFVTAAAALAGSNSSFAIDFTVRR